MHRLTRVRVVVLCRPSKHCAWHKVGIHMVGTMTKPTLDEILDLCSEVVMEGDKLDELLLELHRMLILYFTVDQLQRLEKENKELKRTIQGMHEDAAGADI